MWWGWTAGPMSVCVKKTLITRNGIARYLAHVRITKFHQIIDRALLSNTITKDKWEYIRTTDLRFPTFDALPKIHKSTTSPPGRPFVSGIGTLTERASRVVDGHLRLHVTALPSHVQDTPHLLPLLRDLLFRLKLTW